ncbi:unnamed protein product [Euphydryas editha]|uniref:Secreted protein n=1 Tax=Euphydryas editha TaxID=104508 RepID=A0AAU9TM27_EUPED|nr:unnamed protein product [Euphydryas editha]
MFCFLSLFSSVYFTTVEIGHIRKRNRSRAHAFAQTPRAALCKCAECGVSTNERTAHDSVRRACWNYYAFRTEREPASTRPTSFRTHREIGRDRPSDNNHPGDAGSRRSRSVYAPRLPERAMRAPHASYSLACALHTLTINDSK